MNLNMEFTEILGSIDFVIFLVVGVILGAIAGQVMKGGSLVQSVIVGTVGSVISGFVFDWLNFMDIGDYADPIIAGTFGAVILLAIAWAIRGKEKPAVDKPQEEKPSEEEPQ